MNNEEQNTKKTIAYSALTMILMLFIFQAGFGLIINIFKNINIHAQLQIVKKANKKAMNENKKLKYNIETCQSEKSLEAIARNNLKMAADDEILLRIMTGNEELHTASSETKPKKEKGIFFKKNN